MPESTTTIIYISIKVNRLVYASQRSFFILPLPSKPWATSTPPPLRHRLGGGEDEPLGEPRGALGHAGGEAVPAARVELQRHRPPHRRHDRVLVAILQTFWPLKTGPKVATDGICKGYMHKIPKLDVLGRYSGHFISKRLEKWPQSIELPPRSSPSRRPSTASLNALQRSASCSARLELFKKHTWWLETWLGWLWFGRSTLSDCSAISSSFQSDQTESDRQWNNKKNVNPTSFRTFCVAP